MANQHQQKNLRPAQSLRQSNDSVKFNEIEISLFIEELQKTNNEIRESRRALLNALEDAVLSKKELHKADEKYRLKLEQEVRDRTAAGSRMSSRTTTGDT